VLNLVAQGAERGDRITAGATAPGVAACWWEVHATKEQVPSWARNRVGTQPDTSSRHQFSCAL